ncbi:GNAT family N-acetyltransferase [Methanoplanus sp. FWC-SCC4]|uniref:GNAT family N-acetyltransferase n=1 Tax=Methanochimaera problematica TaxID=2609417 RepID=A0AA97FEB5_9EURY|nr:GNAT family N-acetyltransferase [Methanoplanus sp. FWC-SCC4]WOF16478.1 GNAT family N-acetyltransferase [Methanoplanus sp. FWC-SCC4]
MAGNTSGNAENVIVRNLHPAEIKTAIKWAAIEGWNPGIYDGECHYAVDPEGWFAAEINEEMVGIVQFSNYDDNFSFGGFLVVKEEFRNMGIGDALLKTGLAHTKGSICGADGVFEMQDTYSRKYGLIFAYRNIRWEGEIRGEKNHGLLKAEDVPFESLLSYDARHFPVVREKFLERWVNQKESTCLVSCEGDLINGYGMIRKCVEGYKIGPLFADNPDIAEKIFSGLCGSVESGPVYLDTPEPNSDAVALAKKYNMTEVFGTARMYTKEIPKLPLENIFGVTSFEMG